MTCCPTSGRADEPTRTTFAATEKDVSTKVRIPGGTFMLGAKDRIMPQDGEYPPRAVKLRPFAVDACAVSNARFARFIADTGYITDAQRYGWSFVFHSLLDNPDSYARLAGLEWGCHVDGACWEHPKAPHKAACSRRAFHGARQSRKIPALPPATSGSPHGPSTRPIPHSAIQVSDYAMIKRLRAASPALIHANSDNCLWFPTIQE